MPCAAHAVAVRDHLDELGHVVMITFTDPAQVQTYAALHDLRFPILVDRDRDAYRAYGLGRGRVARIWGWRAGRRYWQLLRRDGIAGLGRPTEDTLQLGGDFVIAPDGSLAWGFWGAGPDDRPEPEELVRQVRRAAG